MKIKEFINEDKIFTQVEDEVREWVEKTYEGLSTELVLNPLGELSIEIVRTNENIDYNKEQVKEINEVVNKKIEDILFEHREEIYIAQKLTKIWKKYPRFSIDVNSIEDIKRNKKFLKRFKEIGGDYGRAK